MTCASRLSVTIAHGAYLYSVVQNMTIRELQHAENTIGSINAECIANWNAWQQRYPNLVNAAKRAQNEAFNAALDIECA